MAIEKRFCTCGSTTGEHESWCALNDLYKTYCCSRCGKPTTPEEGAFGLCDDCNRDDLKRRSSTIGIPGETDLLESAINGSFIGDFAKYRFTATQEEPRTITLNLLCTVEFEVENVGNLPIRFNLSQRFHSVELENQRFCDWIARDMSESFIRKIPKMKSEIAAAKGKVVSATFRVV